MCINYLKAEELVYSHSGNSFFGDFFSLIYLKEDLL